MVTISSSRKRGHYLWWDKEFWGTSSCIVVPFHVYRLNAAHGKTQASALAKAPVQALWHSPPGNKSPMQT